MHAIRFDKDLSIDLWNKRLGHLLDKELTFISHVSQFSISNNSRIYDVCPRTNQQRNNFSLCEHIACSLFELVNLIFRDLMHSFFLWVAILLKIVDDYLLIVWVYW